MKWQSQERRLAKKVKGSVNAGSGSFWSRKGDVRNEYYLIEAKWTDASFYRLGLQTWKKCEDEAFLIDRTPVLALHIDGIDFIVMDASDLPVDAVEVSTIRGSKSVALYAGKIYARFLQPIAEGLVPYSSIFLSGRHFVVLLESSLDGDVWTSPSTHGGTTPSA